MCVTLFIQHSSPPLPLQEPTPEPVAEPEPEPEPTSPVDGGEYGKTFTGDGTYYAPTDAGNCGYKGNVLGMYSGMIPSERKRRSLGGVSWLCYNMYAVRWWVVL